MGAAGLCGLELSLRLKVPNHVSRACAIKSATTNPLRASANGVAAPHKISRIVPASTHKELASDAQTCIKSVVCLCGGYTARSPSDLLQCSICALNERWRC